MSVVLIGCLCLAYRADYWKSQDRKYCDFCKCWIADNKPVSHLSLVICHWSPGPRL